MRTEKIARKLGHLLRLNARARIILRKTEKANKDQANLETLFIILFCKQTKLSNSSKNYVNSVIMKEWRIFRLISFVMSVRHSKIQKQVLSLYKAFLRASQGKPGFEYYVKSEFKKNAALDKKNVLQIEFLMRKGQRKLDEIKDPHVSGMGLFVDDDADKKK